MKPIHAIVFFLITIIIAVSCRKDNDALFDGINCSGNCYILTGKLIDSASDLGIQGGEIKFYFKDNTGTFSEKTIFLGRTGTDAAGTYTFKFDGSRFNNVRGYYYADAFSGKLFADPLNQNQVATFALDTSFYNAPLVQNFALFRPATIKVRIIAANVTNFQYLTLGYSYGKVGHGLVLNGGRQIDTTISWKTAGDLRTFLQADAVGNGINIHKRDTFTVPANTTRQVEVRL